MFIKIKNLFNYLAFLVIELFLTGKTKINAGRLLLIRLDAIGDYVLFRNYIKVLKESEKYKTHKITLCGNIIWKDLAETLDKDFIDKFIWIDRKRFYSNILYKFKILKLIHNYSFEIAIEATYSREILYGDEIIKVSGAKERIGSQGSLDKHSKWKRNLFSDRWYTELISSTEKNLFEFFRNREFFQHLIGTEINLKKPSIDTAKIPTGKFQTENYIVLFPGASTSEKRWDVKNFIVLTEHILNKTSFHIIIDGSKKEVNLAETIRNKIGSERIVVAAGSTSLSQMAKLLSGAKLLISNETSAVHFAAAVNTKFICISNGAYYNRFHPYPKEVFKDAYYIYPEEIKNEHNAETYRFHSGLDINKIKPADVITLFDKLI